MRQVIKVRMQRPQRSKQWISRIDEKKNVNKSFFYTDILQRKARTEIYKIREVVQAGRDEAILL